MHNNLWNNVDSFASKLNRMRSELIELHPEVNRLAIAIYHEELDVLRTFVASEDHETGLFNYEAKLHDSVSLSQLAETGEDRILNDLSILKSVDVEHAQRIYAGDYRSSYTIPLKMENRLVGFLFANSCKAEVFKGDLIKQLRLIAMVMGLTIFQSHNKLNVLNSTLESMKVVSFQRDPETANHLCRMSNFCTLIASELTKNQPISDVQIEYLYQFAPMHDVGKINTPDSILLKPGKLTYDEFEIMKEHASAGHEMMRQLINIYHLADLPYLDDLFAIVRWHHEKLDGSGYPDGLKGDRFHSLHG